jgi:signal transduction histidine kinase
MNRVGGSCPNPHRPWRSLAIRAAAPAGAAGPAWAAVQGSAETAGRAMTLVLALAIVAAALAGGVLLALRLARARTLLTAQLREARARSASIEPLLDVWLWQSDAQHRTLSLRPPHGAPAAAWPAEAAPQPLWQRFGSADPGALQAMLAAAAPLDDLEVRLAGAEGSAPRPGRLRGRAHTDDAGRFAGYHGTFREHAAAVAAPPVPAAAPAEPADRAEDHESFSFTVSHDLRAPIRVVEGFTKIVKEDYGRLLDRVGNDHLDRVLGAAARMNNMIDALLSLSKLSSQPLAQQPVNLSQLAGFVTDDLRRQWPDRAVQIEIAPGMQVQGDPTLLRVVIENLLGNAWKYTAKSAHAAIRFGPHADAPDTFTVQDNGAGFDMRFADRLFGVFQRLHSASDYPGTGVGLASVRRIVRRHGGEIWGEAEVNRGARFHFSLPQRRAAPRPIS